MRKNRVIEQNRCYHLISRLAHRAFFLDDEEKDRAVALMRRVEAGVKASMSYCINRTVSISPFDPCGSVECGKEFKRLMPEFKVLSCLNCRRGWKKGAKPIAVSEIVLTTRNMGADGVDVRYDREVTTAEYIRTIRDDGLELHVWTVDDLADTLEAFQRGAQTVTTNCAKKLLDEYRESAK